MRKPVLFILICVVVGLGIRSLVSKSSSAELFATRNVSPMEQTEADVLSKLLSENETQQSVERMLLKLEAEFLSIVDELDAHYARLERDGDQAWQTARDAVPRVVRRIQLGDPDKILSQEVVGENTTHAHWALPHDWQ